ncbi:hypothetical protein EU528_09845 [Candidatus Thorarchaeota archaeon]|nr:MAG: hypothetical protein EU528_09845 [Candidatus Thorarchaeota archaeon]
MDDDSSLIGRRLKQTGGLLLGGAQKQVKDYKGKFESLRGVYDEFLSKLLTSYHSAKFNPTFVDKFFGKRKLRFAGLDGTVLKYDVFDLLIFFAGAYPAFGEIEIDDKGESKISYDEKFLEHGVGISSVLPVYISEVPQIDQTLLVRSENGEVDHSISYSDSWVVDNSAFADFMMGLSEFFLGYQLVSSENPVDILLHDRVFSSEVASFYAETSDFRLDLDHECGLIGYKIDGRPLTKTEWVYARRLFGNINIGTPAARGEFLLPRIIIELMNAEGNSLTRDELVERMGLDNEFRHARLDKELKKGIRGTGEAEGVFVRNKEYFVLKPQFRDLKKRMGKLVDDVCGRIFSTDPEISYEERFKVNGRWLTTSDLAFLSLMALYLTIEKCWENHILLVGVAKDTSARDLKRQVLPVLNFVGRFQGGFTDRREDTPDTDRMILQWVSLQEREKLKVPWATVEYDTAFKTIVPHLERTPGLVSGARRNQIALEKTFLKSYFQLCQASSEPKLRSNVLLYDRLVYPEFENQSSNIVFLKHDYENRPDFPEPVEVIFYEGQENQIQSFILPLFKAMTSMSIPELFGHLKPLYIADKIAKYHFGQVQGMIASTGNWLMNRPDLREFLFYLSSFRERRSSHEQSRRNT